MRYLAFAAITSITTADYIWPGRYDHMEDLIYLQGGYKRSGFVDGILSCEFGQNDPGRQNSAEWIRTAYHDMATADVEAGTGGLDASIIYETGRGENRGSAFANTFGHLSGFHTVRSSGADLLALAVVGSMSVCGGYEVPLRVGRIDATEAGRSGVPEPQQDLDTHTKMFAMQGFNQTEMIELVACGHTLGGVHHEDFPEITGDSTAGQVTHFEYGTSNARFDNLVIHEYLESNTSNPLVSGANDTMNSDKRIFGADGNRTMEALTDPKHFQERCQILMGRMIDTVPSTVILSEPIAPIDVKPYIDALSLNANGSLDFSGSVRVRYGADTGLDADDLSVHITYLDRNGKNITASIDTARPAWKSGIATGLQGQKFVFFEWNTQISASEGISAFNIHLATLSTKETTVFQNGGNGFPVQDSLLYQAHQSCQNFVSNGSGGWDGSLTVVAAVRRDVLATSTADLALHFVKHIPQEAILDRLEIQVEDFVKTNRTVAGYDLYEVRNMAINGQSDATTFDIVLNDATRVEFQGTSALNSNSCTPL